MRPLAIPSALFTLLTLGCARRDARELLDQIREDDYRGWTRAPGWEAPRSPARGGPHGKFIDIYVNDVLADATEESQLAAWPDGALIVKDGWNDDAGNDLQYIVVMEKRGDDWFWAEYDDDDKVKYAGTAIRTCTSCHERGDDYVLAFKLPR